MNSLPTTVVKPTPSTVDIDRLLRRVQKPARYTGGELHSVAKDWAKVPVRMALCYPDIYEIGMSNNGLAQLYDIMQYPTVICIDDSGLMQNMWPGLPMPTISEVSYYA